MKKLFPLLLAAALLCGGLFRGQDVGKLRPMEVIALSMDRDSVVLRTDTGDTGKGENVNAAMEELKEGSYGVLFLDTADYLLLDEDAQRLLPELGRYLRPGCGVCLTRGEMDLTEIAQFLSVHMPENTIQELLTEGGEIPLLIREGEKLYFE